MYRQLLSTACHSWQRLFRANHDKFSELDVLFGMDSENKHEYHTAYFDWESKDRSFPELGECVDTWHDKVVLDYGCGVGGLTFALAQRCKQAYGIEVQKEMVEFGSAELIRRGQSNATLLHYDGNVIPLDDQTIDVALCIDVIEHVANPGRTITELFRVLRPGGILRLGFGPPWYHAHGKHLWKQLPGWWSHVIFPRGIVMEVLGHPSETTWEDLGMNRMSYSGFRRLMNRSDFEELQFYVRMRPLLRPIVAVPGIRELFIGALGGVWKKPSSIPRPASTHNSQLAHA
jgi:ubiquinone/menaquinone biosynthesis C-methylase UbiE